MLKKNEYQCSMCGGVFEKGWSDEDAAKELAENFSGATPDESGLVCDDCYNKIMGVLGPGPHPKQIKESAHGEA